MTSTAQLNFACGDIPGFVGVYAEDELEAAAAAMDSKPRRLGGFSLIANYSSLGDPRGGTHWISIARLRDAAGAPVLWFDSFGAAPDRDDDILRVHSAFRKFAVENSHAPGRAVISNEWDLQAVEDDVCGELSAIFCRGGVGLGAAPIAQTLPELDKRQLDATGRQVFRGPWSKFLPVRRLGPSFRPSSQTLHVWQADARDEQKARQNGAMARQLMPIRGPG